MLLFNPSPNKLHITEKVIAFFCLVSDCWGSPADVAVALPALAAAGLREAAVLEEGVFE